ncbi:MAG: hypothetical protein B6U97_03260 [Candidatus Altiarchaeales archaeon ex4484_96]|nr:MAG: hypothetical protein B6U97_03260 [Candidatus Altiarchaeales archaeon ex4484_96]
MKVLLTLGTTQEPIDPVRYITTASSGRMGQAMAEEALKRGYDVSIVAGVTGLTLPSKAQIHRVQTTKQMIIKSLEEIAKGYDILISTAAIADYSPTAREEKIKSTNKTLVLKLKPNPKLTRIVKEKYRRVYVVAFKAEYGLPKAELMRAAYNKLRDENLDVVVGNDIKKHQMGSQKNEVVVLNKNGEYVFIPPAGKKKIATRIWDIIDSTYSKD